MVLVLFLTIFGAGDGGRPSCTRASLPPGLIELGMMRMRFSGGLEGQFTCSRRKHLFAYYPPVTALRGPLLKLK